MARAKFEEMPLSQLTLVGVKVLVSWDVDESGVADLSYLGEYIREYKEGALDRQVLGDWQSGQMRYWMPSSNHYPHDPKSWEHVPPAVRKRTIKKYGSLKKADESYVLQDYRRCEDFNDGKFWMERILVEVQLGAMAGKAALHAIESDSTREYLKEVETEQIKEAMADLREKILKRISVE